MDDHVHPTLRGQALIAEAIVDRLAGFDGKLRIPPENRAKLPDWGEYARRLGTNVYDDYAVAHNMRLVFSAQFMRRYNSEAFLRFSDRADRIEKTFTPDLRGILHEWQATRPFEGSRCPVTAAVAQLLLKNDDYKNALGLYQIAERAVPPYTSWFLEYTYYDLFCRLKLNGGLVAEDKKAAHKAIEQGRFLAEHVPTEIDFTKRFTGLLHMLCGEFSEAIPYIAAIEPQQTGIDRLAMDQALFVCYAETRQFGKARDLLREGVASGGEYAPQYQALMGQLTALENRDRSASGRK